MKPTRMQYIIAEGWLDRVWNAVIPSLCALGAVRMLEPTLALLGNWNYFSRFSVIIVTVLMIGYLLALMSGWLIFGPIKYARSRENGAPFHEGDVVQILMGPYRDRVVPVYKVLEERKEVRVELGEKEKEDLKDFFSYTQICRET